MKKLIILIIAVAALHHFKPEIFSTFQLPFSKQGAFDTEGNPEVLVFTQRDCQGWCEKGMDEIRNHHAPFTELQLDGNEENAKRFREMGGRGTLPFIVVGDQLVHGYERAAIVSALAEAYGDKSLNEIERIYYDYHFYEDGSPRVYMYGVSWCPHCKRMREEFSSRNIDYVEIDVENAADQALMKDTMQINGYPAIYVGYRLVHGGANITNVLDSIKKAGTRRL